MERYRRANASPAYAQYPQAGHAVQHYPRAVARRPVDPYGAVGSRFRDDEIPEQQRTTEVVEKVIEVEKPLYIPVNATNAITTISTVAELENPHVNYLSDLIDKLDDSFDSNGVLRYCVLYEGIPVTDNIIDELVACANTTSEGDDGIEIDSDPSKLSETLSNGFNNIGYAVVVSDYCKHINKLHLHDNEKVFTPAKLYKEALDVVIAGDVKRLPVLYSYIPRIDKHIQLELSQSNISIDTPIPKESSLGKFLEKNRINRCLLSGTGCVYFVKDMKVSIKFIGARI